MPLWELGTRATSLLTDQAGKLDSRYKDKSSQGPPVRREKLCEDGGRGHCVVPARPKHTHRELT
eukprot:562566-Amphidinium_carterae.1